MFRACDSFFGLMICSLPPGDEVIKQEQRRKRRVSVLRTLGSNGSVSQDDGAQ